MLEIRGLFKKYKGAERPALDAVSFSVTEGGFIALLGPNGAGKSTLIGILAGTVKPDGGAVTVNGFPLQSRDPRLKLSLGIVPQEIALDPYFTVEETLHFQSGYFGIRRNQEWIRMLLRRLSLWEKRREPVKSLSGGMKRRLLIAKALVHRPRLLLLDEPTAGVDIHLRMRMHELLTELNREGLTIVLTTHYLEEAEKLCERVVLLNRGAIVADAAREDFVKLAGDRFIADIESGAPERLRDALLPLGIGQGEESGAAIRYAISRSQRSRFLSALGEHAEEVTDIRISRPSLEDAFRKLTDTAEDQHDATA